MPRVVLKGHALARRKQARGQRCGGALRRSTGAEPDEDLEEHLPAWPEERHLGGYRHADIRRAIDIGAMKFTWQNTSYPERNIFQANVSPDNSAISAELCLPELVA